MDELKLTTEFDVSPAVVYAAWLDSKSHSEMTGGAAITGGAVGDEFSAWDGYITGKNLELEKDRRIVQAWRTLDFPEDAPDSRLELELVALDDDGCFLRLTHTNLPEGQGPDYAEGWEDNYFEPMRAYFGEFESSD